MILDIFIALKSHFPYREHFYQGKSINDSIKPYV